MSERYQIEHKFKVAADFEEQGKPLHAIQIYQNIIDEYPDNIEVYFSLAELYERMGNLPPAFDLLYSRLEETPEDDQIRLFLGQFLLRNSKWEEAIEVLSLILPEEVHVVSFFLGYSHFVLKEYEMAKVNFLKYISFTETADSFNEQIELVHEANLYLSKIEIELGNYEDALRYAKKTDIIYSNFWELNLIYAIIYYNLGMYAHGVVPVEKAIKLNPKEAPSYEWGGKIYLKLGDYLKAEKLFLKYIEHMDNVSSDIYTKLAEACLKASKIKDAMNYFEVALKLDPDNIFAKEGKKNASLILNKSKASDG
jgi:tetratricopeptide (TPR) repeat protein